jgi:hypothetical protein
MSLTRTSRILRQRRNSRPQHSHSRRRWSQRVTRTSNALDLETNVFALDDPRRIALSLKRSAQRSRRRKAEPFRSAMSMLTFYINRAGRRLRASRKRILEQAKRELRLLFEPRGAIPSARLARALHAPARKRGGSGKRSSSRMR